ncbi:3-deoxy-manno-octulosonate-8-phosphatase KdsC [Rheinheimera riviphila]|uniref:3-deoxy-manno-octulosonate-8-phosphatase KdsC n=1 Tax=Rheinheimera riviphila TaxID=1834037 RepID=UPI00197D3257|nr:3-deoxy-manno-octulosonate-8-phosphatase KdsC [Rheinheimera riviphila]
MTELDSKLFADLYQPLPAGVAERASDIRLLICDVDGVFSDGRIYLGNQGEELKAFHTRDGYGIKALRHAGIEVAVITGRNSDIVSARMKSLTVPYVYQGQEDKMPAFAKLQQQLELSPTQIAYIGDDLSDWNVMQHCGLAVAVNDAHPYLRRHAHYTTSLNGGFGAVRELCDLLLICQQKFATFSGSST